MTKEFAEWVELVSNKFTGKPDKEVFVGAVNTPINSDETPKDLLIKTHAILKTIDKESLLKEVLHFLVTHQDPGDIKLTGLHVVDGKYFFDSIMTTEELYKAISFLKDFVMYHKEVSAVDYLNMVDKEHGRETVTAVAVMISAFYILFVPES